MSAKPLPHADRNFAVGVVGILLCLTLTLFGIWLWQQLAIAQAAREAAPPGSTAECRQPVETEQLHIIVTPRAGKFTVECKFYGSRGTYNRSRHGMPEPRP